MTFFIIQEVLIPLVGGGYVCEVYVHAWNLIRLESISNYHNNLQCGI